jgi:dTDP-4-dehydrorhamnose 3,5-epimerase
MAVTTTEITGHNTDIPGLMIFDITDVSDERGYYQEKYQKAKLVAAGMNNDFNVVQTNVSFNRQRGVTRGFHAEPWDKYISVVSGKVFAAYVDLRAGSSFGKKITVEINKNVAVFLPQGVANSFQTLDDNTYYHYSVNAFWSANNYDEYCFVNLADKDLNIEWPIPLDESVISERDKNHPKFTDIKPMEIK